MSTPLIIANIEYINGFPFFVAVVFDAEGERIDELTLEFSNYEDAVLLIQSEMYLSQEHKFEVWTSDHGLYGECQKIPGIAVQFKHRTNTGDTGRIIERDKEILTDLYDIEPLPELSKFRLKAFYYFAKLTMKIGAINQNDNHI